MPSERTLSIFSGIAQGLEKAATNIENISAAKEKLRREDEEFQLNKKVKDAQLKVLEAKTSPEAIADLRETHNAEMKAKKAAFDLSQIQIGKAELDNRKKEQELRKEGELRVMAGMATLKDAGYTEEEARDKFASFFTPETATVGGRQVPVAPGEYVDAASSYDRGDASVGDPFMRELGKATRARTGITKEQATDKLYGRKDVSSDSDTEFLKSIGIEEADTENITPKQEEIIQSNMDYYGKSREEVIAALKKVGKL